MNKLFMFNLIVPKLAMIVTNLELFTKCVTKNIVGYKVSKQFHICSYLTERGRFISRAQRFCL